MLFLRSTTFMGSSKVEIGISFKVSPFCVALSNKTQLPCSVESEVWVMVSSIKLSHFNNIHRKVVANDQVNVLAQFPISCVS